MPSGSGRRVESGSSGNFSERARFSWAEEADATFLPRAAPRTPTILDVDGRFPLRSPQSA
jgi:hypothetical protein